MGGLNISKQTFYAHAQFVLNHAHFCMIEAAIMEFLGEKMNCKSSVIDLAAIKAHLLIIMQAW